MSIEEREQISLQVTVSVYLDAALRQAGVCDKTHKAGSRMIRSQLSVLGLKKGKRKFDGIGTMLISSMLKGKVPSVNLI